MKKRVIEFLQEEKHVINTRTQKEYDELMQYFEWLGFWWYGNEKPTEYNAFPKYEKDTCINLENVKICYGCIKFSLDKGEKIVAFNHFKDNFVSKDKQYQLHLAKQRVEQLEKEIEEETKKYYVRLKNIGKVNFDKKENYFLFDSTCTFDDKQAEFDVKIKFTKQELIDLEIWDNELFDFVEVEDENN